MGPLVDPADRVLEATIAGRGSTETARCRTVLTADPRRVAGEMVPILELDAADPALVGSRWPLKLRLGRFDDEVEGRILGMVVALSG